MDPQSLRQLILDSCRNLRIPLAGIAPVSRWRNPLFHPWIPASFHPDAIFPETRSVLVIGLAVQLPVLETSPSIWYRELYKTVNSLLDQYTYQIATMLTDAGCQAVFVPRDGYGSITVLQKNPIAFFSHRHAAVLAGLGSFGMNNMVLTPEFGPRVRFGSVFITADITPDPLISEELCIRCTNCVRHCPVGALDEGEYPLSLTEKSTCASHSAELNQQYISPCGICIKVCPVGKDRERYNRTNTGIYNQGIEVDNLNRAWNHVRQYGGL